MEISISSPSLRSSASTTTAGRRTAKLLPHLETCINDIPSLLYIHTSLEAIVPDLTVRPFEVLSTVNTFPYWNYIYLEKRSGILGVVADQYVKLATSEILRGTAAAKGNPTELGGKTTDPNSLVAPAILCKQLQQRIALHQFSRLFQIVEDLHGRIDAESVVDGGDQVGRMHRRVDRRGALIVRLAVQRAAVDPGARHQGGGAIGPGG